MIILTNVELLRDYNFDFSAPVFFTKDIHKISLYRNRTSDHFVMCNNSGGIVISLSDLILSGWGVY